MIYSQFESLETVRARAAGHHTPILSQPTQSVITTLLLKYQPTFAAEVGSAIGYSTRLIAESIQSRNGSLVSFEVSHPSYLTALAHLHQVGLTNTTLYYGNVLSLPVLKLGLAQIDFLFIDGAKTEYIQYLKTFLPLLATSCTIVCDDIIVYQDKVGDISGRARNHGFSYETVLLPDGDGVSLLSRE